MHVLMVSPVFRPKINGTVRVIENLALNLLNAGYEVTLVTQALHNTPPSEIYKGTRIIRVKPIGSSLRKRTRFTVNATILIKRLFQHEHFNLVHAFGASSLLSSAIGSPIRTPIVVTFPGLLAEYYVTGDPERYVKYLLSRLLGIILSFRASAITVPSPSAKDIFLKLYGKILRTKTYVLPNGINLKFFYPKNYRKKKEFYPEILYVGNLAIRKGIGILIKAMPIVLKEFPKARLIVIGSGRQYQVLKNLVQQMHLNESIIFKGFIPDNELLKFYAQCDIFVLPSLPYGEAFGIVLLEAMAMEKPVIATHTPGPRDLIKDGENGFLVEPNNPKAIANAVLRIAQDENLAKNIAQQARKDVERSYEIGKVINRLERIYAKCCLY